jgi:hypothetical protein
MGISYVYIDAFILDDAGGRDVDQTLSFAACGLGNSTCRRPP